ncbi:uncharacterized protein LOC133408116 [Phycodurus eques]|uniref:uncharacterized protein LOC133408116 n=1 Tax=Phycodurus eques TaxID=693459 RepID=UPI002ACF06BA|nr:uncharacterized protein LOC133408116 [Phycodurus eques]
MSLCLGAFPSTAVNRHGGTGFHSKEVLWHKDFPSILQEMSGDWCMKQWPPGNKRQQQTPRLGQLPTLEPGPHDPLSLSMGCSSPHTTPIRRRTNRPTVVSPCLFLRNQPPPPPAFLHTVPPLPTQACDVTVSDNEVRILLRPSVILAPVCEDDSGPSATPALPTPETPASWCWAPPLGRGVLRKAFRAFYPVILKVWCCL